MIGAWGDDAPDVYKPELAKNTPPELMFTGIWARPLVGSVNVPLVVASDV